MEGIIQWGLLFIEYLQQCQSPFLIGFFKFFTSLGSEIFYLIFFPFLLWCVNFKLGIRIGVLFLVSVYLNSICKLLFQQPRPFDLLPDLKLFDAEGFGLPSGHAQSSLLVWLSIAYYYNRKAIWLLSALLIFLISFSRIYLGVHFPHDVIGGWLLGGLVFLIYHYIIKIRFKDIKKTDINLQKKLIYISFLPVILFIFPTTSDVISVVAVLTGVAWGLGVNTSLIHFQGSHGNLNQKIIRFLIGIAGLLILYFTLKTIFPKQGDFSYSIFYFIRYAILGLWLGAGAPWIFSKLRLIGKG